MFRSLSNEEKDILFLREVNNFKFITVHRSKEVSARGGREGPVRASFPHAPSRMQTRARSARTAPCVGRISKWGLSLTGL